MAQDDSMPSAEERECDCGCGRKFKVPYTAPHKRFFSAECKDRFHAAERKEVTKILRERKMKEKRARER